jgi:hypothetical protein
MHATLLVHARTRAGVPGSKHIYLGLYEAEDQAARAYDRALVRLRGTAAATNFGLSEYQDELGEHQQMQQVCARGGADEPAQPAPVTRSRVHLSRLSSLLPARGEPIIPSSMHDWLHAARRR